MSDNLKCPECETPVEPTGRSSTYGLGTADGNIAWQPQKERTTCAECFTELERNIEPPADQWRVAPGPPSLD